MKLPRYEYVTESEAELFKFTSEGKKGSIKKLVVYSQMLEKDIYNLAFGDYIEETDSINDTVITDKHPNVWVYAAGSNAARTRLYRMGITTNLEEILEDFEVYGLSGDTWQEFEKGKKYEAFLVKRKLY
jgi:hypothetical protein